MAVEFKLPELGENIDSASVVKVLVGVGDRIDKDQPVLELETDKATIEVPATVGGVVREIHVKEGGKATVGQVVLTVDSDSIQPAPPAAPAKKAGPAEVKPAAAEVKAPSKEAKPAPSALAAQPAPVTGGSAQFRIPELGENIDSATVVRVAVSVGDRVEKEQTLLELETDKATIEVPSEFGGVVSAVHIKAGEKVEVGQMVVEFLEVSALPAPEPAPAEVSSDQRLESRMRDAMAKQDEPRLEEPFAGPMPALFGLERSVRMAPAAPSVRRFAREIGVDVQQVRGTGPRGRISSDDVKRFARARSKESAAAGPPALPPLPDFAKWGEVERKPMTSIRLKTAQNMTIAWNAVPCVTQYDKADITELEEHRKKFGKKVETAGGKLTITAILLKVVASALKTFPQFNASVDMARQEIVYKKYCNIGVAVDTDRGLLVPVIRDAGEKNILQLSVELNELAEKARNKKLSLEEMQGGTFTITNLGGIGGTAFSPIVNYPEVAILGISRSSLEPVYIDGKLEPRLMMPISLSYDHRVIDGADGARFVRWIAEALKDPFLIALEG